MQLQPLNVTAQPTYVVPLKVSSTHCLILLKKMLCTARCTLCISRSTAIAAQSSVQVEVVYPVHCTIDGSTSST